MALDQERKRACSTTLPSPHVAPYNKTNNQKLKHTSNTTSIRTDCQHSLSQNVFTMYQEFHHFANMKHCAKHWHHQWKTQCNTFSQQHCLLQFYLQLTIVHELKCAVIVHICRRGIDARPARVTDSYRCHVATAAKSLGSPGCEAKLSNTHRHAPHSHWELLQGVYKFNWTISRRFQKGFEEKSRTCLHCYGPAM